MSYEAAAEAAEDAKKLKARFHGEEQNFIVCSYPME
jgi:hypothetical protein